MKMSASRARPDAFAFMLYSDFFLRIFTGLR
jgi:hypothetical protein